jgi:MSHA biogenesis protein MshI
MEGPTLFKRLRLGRQEASCYAGISLHHDGARGALLRALPGDRVSIEALAEARGGDTRGEQIATVLRELGARRRTPLTVVLDRSDYALLQIEPPELPPEELHEALRWRVRDMVDFPVDEAVIDQFELPPSQRAGAPRLSCVVCAPPQPLDEIAVAANGTELRAIDIPEMALRDLVMHALDDRPHAWLYLAPRMALIEILKGDRIWLSRQIELTAGLFQGGEPAAQDIDDLLLEVQRSLDYYQSLYATGPVDSLQVLGTSPAVEAAFVLSAAVYLSVPLGRFELDGFEGLEDHDEQQQRQSLLAIGAALREMPCAA